MSDFLPVFLFNNPVLDSICPSGFVPNRIYLVQGKDSPIEINFNCVHCSQPVSCGKNKQRVRWGRATEWHIQQFSLSLYCLQLTPTKSYDISWNKPFLDSLVQEKGLAVPATEFKNIQHFKSIFKTYYLRQPLNLQM